MPHDPVLFSRSFVRSILAWLGRATRLSAPIPKVHLRVKRRHQPAAELGLLYPQEQTFEDAVLLVDGFVEIDRVTL